MSLWRLPCEVTIRSTVDIEANSLENAEVKFYADGVWRGEGSQMVWRDLAANPMQGVLRHRSKQGRSMARGVREGIVWASVRILPYGNIQAFLGVRVCNCSRTGTYPL
jgi:hypothetical protein